MTEYQGLQNLSEVTIKAEAAEKLFEEARQRLAEHQASDRQSVTVKSSYSLLYLMNRVIPA